MNRFIPKDEDAKCAPSKTYDNDAKTCFTLEQLVAMAQSYNKTIPTNKIKITNDKKDMLRQLINKLEKACNEQVCLLRQPYVRQLKDLDILYNTFLPHGPSYKHQWLSTSDINQVMVQYSEKYKDFMFFGALPIDFKEIKEPISYENFFGVLSNLYKDGKYRIGYVFNLDRHDQPGSHWVALFADLKRNQVYFFDSAEDHSTRKPKKEITSFMKTFAIWCYYHNIKKQPPSAALCKDTFFAPEKNDVEKYVDVRYNKVQHQYGNSECGVYAINFIVRMLSGDDYDTIVNTPISDNTMNQYRTKIFRFK